VGAALSAQSPGPLAPGGGGPAERGAGKTADHSVPLIRGGRKILHSRGQDPQLGIFAVIALVALTLSCSPFNFMKRLPAKIFGPDATRWHGELPKPRPLCSKQRHYAGVEVGRVESVRMNRNRVVAGRCCRGIRHPCIQSD